MFNFMQRMVGGFLFLLVALIVTCDVYTIAEGDFERTVAFALILVGARTGQPTWFPVVMWVMPMFAGMFFILMPASRSARSIREEALRRERERGLSGNT